MDSLNETGWHRPLKAGIPTREEHERTIRRVWKVSAIIASSSFLALAGMGGIMLALGVDIKTVVSVYLVIIYTLLPLYAIGYMAPILMSSLLKMTLGMEMNRDGLEITERMTQSVDGLQDEIRPVLEDMKEITRQAQPVVDALERAVIREKLLEGLAADMRAIRLAIEERTAPLPVRRRPVDGDGKEPVPASYGSGGGRPPP